MRAVRVLTMQYRVTAPTGQVLDEGEGQAEVAGGAVVVSPKLGQPLRIKPSDVVEISEPAPYVVRLRLTEGPVVDLWQLGALRTQLMDQIGQVRADDTTSTLLLAGIGKPVIYHGAVNEIEAQIRLYDDALVCVPTAGTPEQVPFSFIESVTTDPSGYRISVDTGEGPPMVIQRLARMTSEFVDQLQKRVTGARGRTSSFLAALMPSLGPLALRSVAGALRDGVAARKAVLDSIEPTVWPSLVEASALPDRARNLAILETMGDVGIGFHQTVSVEQEATGGSGWTPPESKAILDHPEAVPTMPGGFQGMLQSSLMREGPPDAARMMGFGGDFGAFGPILAYSMLGRMYQGMPGGGGGPPHQIQGRADIDRGTATPATTDFDSLSAGGGSPTVLAFAFCLTAAGRLIYEVLNEGDHATYVYAAGPADVRRLNRALVLVGFHVESIYSDASTVGSRYKAAVERLPYLAGLRQSFLGRAIHTDGWERQLRGLAG